MGISPISTRVLDVYTSLAESPTERQTIFRRGQSIRFNVVHQVDPPRDIRYQIYFILQRSFHLGFNQESTYFDVIWKPESLFRLTGSYRATEPTISSFFALPSLPRRPTRPLDDTIRSLTNRRLLFDELVSDRTRAQAVYSGPWTLTSIVVVGDGDTLNDALDFDVSQPWHYEINYY